MILILLGTIQLEFVRPLKEIEKLCEKGIIQDKIIVQSGFTKYNSKYFEIIPFIEPDILNQLIEDAELVISHAGTGSVVGALKKQKKVIAVARYVELTEHVDNHQLDLLEEFEKKGYLIPWYKDDNVIELFTMANNFKPNPYLSQKEHILKYLENYILSI